MKNNFELNLNLWIARDRNGYLYLYKEKPIKGRPYGDSLVMWYSNACSAMPLQLLLTFIPNAENYFDFSQVKYEDNEPKQLKDILNK